MLPLTSSSLKVKLFVVKTKQTWQIELHFPSERKSRLYAHWKNHMIFIAASIVRRAFSFLSVTSWTSTRAFHSVISPSCPLQFYTIFTNIDDLLRKESCLMNIHDSSQFCSVSQFERSWSVNPNCGNNSIQKSCCSWKKEEEKLITRELRKTECRGINNRFVKL